MDPLAPPRCVLLVEINEDGTVGGSHQCLYDLATRLDRRCWEPVVLFYQSNRFVERLRAEGVRVITWDVERARERSRRFRSGLLAKLATVTRIPDAIWRRLRLIRRERIDLVHINNSPAIAFDDWLPAAQLARIPIVSHARGPYAPPGGIAARWLARQFPVVIAISENVMHSCLMSGFSRERMRLVYDGIDLERWTPRPPEEGKRIRASNGVPEDALLVVLVGLLRSWKGQAMALKAVDALSPNLRRRLRLWIIGEASREEKGYADQLRRFAVEHGLENMVSFLGFRSDIPQLMGAADIVLHTSTSPEPFGLVVVEGLALGKTVVASRLGGPAEILRCGEGLLFDPSTPEELTSLLAALVASPDRYREIARRGQARAMAFDVQRTVDDVVRIWNEQFTRSAPSS